MTTISRRNFVSAVATGAGLLAANRSAGAQDRPPELRFSVTDDRGNACPCRIHVTDARGKPQQPADLPYWRDHFVCDGRASLRLPPGRYRYEIERGPEHQRQSRTVELEPGRDVERTVRLSRIANLTEQGWYGGDLHVHRPLKDIPLLMRAEDLHIAPVITWWNRTNPWATAPPPPDLLRQLDGNRFYHAMGGEDERGGGAVLFFNLDRPLDIAGASREYPSAVKFIADARARSPDVWVDVEKPFWWDVPLWVASGQVDSIGIAHNHMWRGGVYPDEAWGRPRDRARFPDPLGNGYWTQDIYYHLLNCGLRLPPSAGSASGVLPNPVGYNRVYALVEGDLTYEKWWQGLKSGRCFVTNGPLLLCEAGTHPPGYVFRVEAGRRLDLALAVQLFSNDPIRRVEFVKNGRVEGEVRLTAGQGAEHRGTANISFAESGWFLVRAVADTPQTFRFASTGPYYVEVGCEARRVSCGSAQFFVDWMAERREALKATGESPQQLAEVLDAHAKAERFWQRLSKTAAAE
jgi:hypothetical protein